MKPLYNLNIVQRKIAIMHLYWRGISRYLDEDSRHLTASITGMPRGGRLTDSTARIAVARCRLAEADAEMQRWILCVLDTIEALDGIDESSHWAAFILHQKALFNTPTSHILRMLKDAGAEFASRQRMNTLYNMALRAVASEAWRRNLLKH